MENSLLMYYSTKRQKTIVVHLDGTVGERSGKPVQLLKDWCWSAGRMWMPGLLQWSVSGRTVF